MAITFDGLKNIIRKGINAANDFVEDRVRGNIDEENLRILADEVQEGLEVDREEAENIATQYLMIQEMTLGFTGATAATRAKGVAQKAFGRVSKDPQARALGKKALAKLQELEKKFNFKAKGNPKTWGRAIVDGLKKNPVLAFLAFTQLDVLVWGPKLISEGLANFGLGDWFKERQFKVIGQTFTATQMEDLAKSLHAQGFTDLFDFDSNERLDLTPTNLAFLAEKARQREVAKGKIPERDDILKTVAERARKGPTIASSGAAAATGSRIQEIIIEGLSQGRIQIPPGSIERIADREELKGVVRSRVAEFLASLPGRIIFDINLVSNFIDDAGVMHLPNPQIFTEVKETSSGESSRTRQNKIVVLDIKFINDAERAVAIARVPLDFSIADNVVTAPADTTKIQEELIVELQRIPLRRRVTEADQGGFVSVPAVASLLSNAIPASRVVPPPPAPGATTAAPASTPEPVVAEPATTTPSGLTEAEALALQPTQEEREGRLPPEGVAYKGLGFISQIFVREGKNIFALEQTAFQTDVTKPVDFANELAQLGITLAGLPEFNTADIDAEFRGGGLLDGGQSLRITPQEFITKIR